MMPDNHEIEELGIDDYDKPATLKQAIAHTEKWLEDAMPGVWQRCARALLIEILRLRAQVFHHIEKRGDAQNKWGDWMVRAEKAESEVSELRRQLEEKTQLTLSNARDWKFQYDRAEAAEAREKRLREAAQPVLKMLKVQGMCIWEWEDELLAIAAALAADERGKP